MLLRGEAWQLLSMAPEGRGGQGMTDTPTSLTERQSPALSLQPTFLGLASTPGTCPH